MRFVIAMMKHETNTFSPVPTPIESFGKQGPFFGVDAYNAYKGTNTPMGAYIDLAQNEAAEIVTPIAAQAWPSGFVHGGAYESIVRAIVDEVKRGCDALFLDLHGAMVTEFTDDGEGTLLERIRCIAPNLPIAVALDLHANITEKMITNCTTLAGYKTYPHIDMGQAGQRAGSLLIRTLKKEINPVVIWGRRPMLPHTLRMGTDDAPMKDLVTMARVAEEEGVLAVSVFGGFPLADIYDAGLSVVVTDVDQSRGKKVCDKILNAAWARREEFVYHSEPLTESIARAKAFSDGPVLLIDHSDNCASGGTQDTMAVLAEAMHQGLKDVAVAAVRDPEAVEAMIRAGVGSRVTIQLGGKMDMPAIRLKGNPLEVTGTVRVISDGEFIVKGPVETGVTTYMGRTAVLDTGPIKIVVIERNHEPIDLGVFRSVGIEPTAIHYLLLKSRIHYRGAFMPIARHIIECDGVGVTSSDYSRFRFQKVRRPIYPLDSDFNLDERP